MSSPNRNLRTRFANQALDFSEAFDAGLGTQVLAPGSYKPQMTAPEGQSTGGGVQAMQHIQLVSSNPGVPAIVVGSANQPGGVAELRSFEYVDAVHRERFGNPVALDRHEYGQFLQMSRNFFDTHRMTTTLSAPPPELAAAQASSATRAKVRLPGVVLGLLAAGSLLYFVLRG